MTPRRRTARTASFLAILTLAALRLRPQRFAVAEGSMTPTLEPGDFLLTVRPWRPLRATDLVVFEHPARAGFHLVKRIERILDDGRLWVAADADRPDAVGSDRLGPIAPDRIVGVVIARYWPRPRWLAGAGPPPARPPTSSRSDA